MPAPAARCRNSVLVEVPLDRRDREPRLPEIQHTLDQSSRDAITSRPEPISTRGRGAEGVEVARGALGAQMRLARVNDGPVTIVLDA